MHLTQLRVGKALIGNSLFAIWTTPKHHTLILIALLEAVGQEIFNVRHLRCPVFLCSQAGPTMPPAIQEAGNLELNIETLRDVRAGRAGGTYRLCYKFIS